MKVLSKQDQALLITMAIVLYGPPKEGYAYVVDADEKLDEYLVCMVNAGGTKQSWSEYYLLWKYAKFNVALLAEEGKPQCQT